MFRDMLDKDPETRATIEEMLQRPLFVTALLRHAERTSISTGFPGIHSKALPLNLSSINTLPSHPESHHGDGMGLLEPGIIEIYCCDFDLFVFNCRELNNID